MSQSWRSPRESLSAIGVSYLWVILTRFALQFCLKSHNLCPFFFSVRPKIISQHLKSTKGRKVRKAKAMEAEGEMQLTKENQKLMIAVESGRGKTLRCTKLRERSDEETEAATGSGQLLRFQERQRQKKRENDEQCQLCLLPPLGHHQPSVLAPQLAAMLAMLRNINRHVFYCIYVTGSP